MFFLSWSHGLFFAWHFRNNGQKSLDFAMEIGKKSLWVIYDMGIDFDSVYTNMYVSWEVFSSPGKFLDSFFKSIPGILHMVGLDIVDWNILS